MTAITYTENRAGQSLTVNVPLLTARLNGDNMLGPNFYRLAVNQLRDRLNHQQAIFRFSLHETTDYGGRLAVMYADSTWSWLSKGKVRWRDLQFYGFNKPT